MVFRLRALVIRQRTQAINALRRHLSEFGQVVPQEAANALKLIAIVENVEKQFARRCCPHTQGLDLGAGTVGGRDQVARHLDRTSCRGERRGSTTDDGAGHWSVDRHGHSEPCAATRDFPQGSRFCGLALSCATTAFDRWQAAARSQDNALGTLHA